MRDIKGDAVMIDYMLHRNLLIDQLAKEQHKGVNRMICIIRDSGRAWDLKQAGNETVTPGGFVKAIKDELIKKDFPQEFINALRYL